MSEVFVARILSQTEQQRHLSICFGGNFTGMSIKTLKNNQGSSPGKDGFFSSKIRTIQEECQNQISIFRQGDSQKSVLGSSHDEGGFFSLETRHDKRTAPRIKLFVSTGRAQELEDSPEKKLYWVRVPLKIISVA
jgi:hypothetical protein